MSADNGIYIASFPDGFRVIHAQCIENCDDSPDYPQELTDWYRVSYFKECHVFATEKEAIHEAFKMDKELRDEGLWTEYGICSLTFDRPLLDMSVNEALDKIDKLIWNKS